MVRVFEEKEAAWVRERGGTPVVFAEAAVDGFLAWYERSREELDARLGRRTGHQPTAPTG